MSFSSMTSGNPDTTLQNQAYGFDNLAILTSGGDAPGMNACIRALVRTGVFYGHKVWGVVRGYDGLIQDDFKEMTLRSVGNIIHRGGTVLKSARSEEFRTAEGRRKAYENLAKGESRPWWSLEETAVSGAPRFFRRNTRSRSWASRVP